MLMNEASYCFKNNVEDTKNVWFRYYQSQLNIIHEGNSAEQINLSMENEILYA